MPRPPLTRFAAAPLPTPTEEIKLTAGSTKVGKASTGHLGRARQRSNCRGSRGLRVNDEPELFADETPDVFADLNRAFMSPTVIRAPAGKVFANPIIVTHRIAGPCPCSRAS